MDKSFWGMQRISGALLVLSLLVTAAGFVGLIIHGKVEGLEAAFNGVEETGEEWNARQSRK